MLSHLLLESDLGRQSVGSQRGGEGRRSLAPRELFVSSKGFQGCFLPGVAIVQPKKKPRGGELTPPEHALKQQRSSIRMRIEQAMGEMKRYRIVQDIIRLLTDGMRDAVMETCCGLQNFRLWYRPWNYAH